MNGKGEPMNDLISRQAAIDALKEHRALFCDNTPDTFSKLSYAEKSRVDELDTAIATLVNLPSAQPERTCVNCGRTANNGGWYADGRTRCPIEEHYALPKDGFCHLWEKRNVTDDDYPERRTGE